jgi:hypothetical protein
MENLEIRKSLEEFIEAIDTFPTSNTKSQFYNIEILGSSKENAQLNEFLGDVEFNKSLRLIHYAQEAIKLCKMGNLEDGFKIFQNVEQKSKDLSENALQYINLYYLSGIAYYHYRTKDYKLSLECTWKEIEETGKLEKKGVSNLHYRRVGHIGNAVKILFVSGKIEDSATLALGMLQYTLNGNISSMPAGEWNDKLLDIIPYVRQRYIDLCFLNIIEMALEKQNDIQYNNNFYNDNVFSKIQDFEVTNNNLAMIYNWLYLQKLYTKQHYKDFILDMIEFCQVPFDYSFDVLKLSHLSKIISFLNSSKTDDKFIEKAKLKINNYILNNLNSKQSLKDKVCDLIFE